MVEDKSKRYEKIEFLGEGQFATVFKARDTYYPDKFVAIKKIKIGTKADAADGINRTALREIKLLQELSHVNVIGLLDVYGHRSSISLVLDFLDFDLEVVIRDTAIVLTIGNIKSYLIQTLRGLEYLHANWILHRDLKPNNLLINREGILKISDFGLAKFFGSPNRVYTHQVVTRWYRSPELLFGARNYGTGIDIWAIGCILAELLLRAPLFPGESDLDQLSKIFDIMGTPRDDDWPEVKSLPDYMSFVKMAAKPFRHIFTAAPIDLIDLLNTLLALNPLKRCNCSEALQNNFFSNRPPPTPYAQLPRPSNAASLILEQDLQQHQQTQKRKRNDASDSGLVKKLQF